MARRKQRNGLFSLYNLLSIDTFSLIDLAKGLAHESIVTLLVDLKLKFPYFLIVALIMQKCLPYNTSILTFINFVTANNFLLFSSLHHFSDQMFYTFITNSII